MDNRKLIKPGYTALNGYVFDDQDCKAYNSIQNRINAFISALIPVPESLLYESHRTFAIITGILIKTGIY